MTNAGTRLDLLAIVREAPALEVHIKNACESADRPFSHGIPVPGALRQADSQALLGEENLALKHLGSLASRGFAIITRPEVSEQ